MEKIPFHNSENFWITVDGSDVAAIAKISTTYQLSDELISYSLDQHERARVEYDSLAETFLLIFNVPHQTKTNNHYETSPLTFIVKDNLLFTIVTDRTAYVLPLIRNILAKNTSTGTYSLLFHALFVISDGYFPLVAEVNAQRTLLNHKLREKTTNKHLLELSDLEIGLVYLVSATRQNAGLLTQFKALEVYRKLNASEKEQLDDALIEANQAVEMIDLASKIIEQLQGTYNNLLNNNLNDTMKFLTVWSLLLTIPAIVTGFFGMNVDLPFTNLGWGVTVLISLSLIIMMIIAMWRKIR
ncbi:magnesium transporter CorA family protein [Enterococcus nangangensis]|uniref:magnesium transporter CorA family protein n=1 Tax=Enterococcus nangangensis TaxID=2559926 RepID=UPI0010F5127A|nr:magnesium transporter CorA family protein [Enterococcus nangangensis]